MTIYEKYCRNCEYDHLASCKGCSTVGELFENFKLRDELAMIENGTLVELPCKIGDTLFKLVTYFDDVSKWRIDVGHCSMLRQKADKTWKVQFSYSNACSYEIRSENFGKTIFTNKKQAEMKFKELKDKKEVKQ